MSPRPDQQATAIRAVARGRVQGVGFRDMTQLRARGLGLTGWVLNATDGGVLVHAEGPEPEVDELVSFLRRGTPASTVTEVTVTPARVEGHQQFAIRGVSSGVFVVQEHLASSRHFDLRLELDGTMRSWAVPRGPTMDPAIKRLAIEMPDHTTADGEFEGLTPNGGVIIWDRGTYERGGLVAWPAALDLGEAEFSLRGEKLRGGFVLRRTGKGPRPRWLLGKRDDEHARPGSEVVTERPRSVVSGLTLDGLLLRRTGP